MTSQLPGPADLDALYGELEVLDDEICAKVLRRTTVARRIGAARLATGGTRIAHTDEISTVRQYRELGRAGWEIAAIMLRLGRGQR